MVEQQENIDVWIFQPVRPFVLNCAWYLYHTSSIASKYSVGFYVTLQVIRILYTVLFLIFLWDSYFSSSVYYWSTARSSRCSSQAFYCDDTCIPMVWKCDGKTDCKDETDESNCSSESKCSEHNFRCALTGECIWTSMRRSWNYSNFIMLPCFIDSFFSLSSSL